jgi:murein DD-endopeptidase MepM/ murein hydrolase activator NlpD
MAAAVAMTAIASSLVGLATSSPDVALAATSPGGTQAPQVPLAGGSEYGVIPRALASRVRPVVSLLSVPASAVAGKPPRVTLRIDEPGVGTVNAQLVLVNVLLQQRAVTVSMGWIHTGRVVAVAWPAHTSLAVGSYQVSLRARDHQGQTLLRRAHSSGLATLTVHPAPPKPQTPKPPAPPATPVAPVSPAATTPIAGVPSPAQSVAGTVFPVQGPHNFGGPENRFGAAREGHIHQGQDVLTVEGTPVVAPMPGSITSTSYQAGGAGYYIVEHTGVGFDFMFAHCQANSTAVSAGQGVSAGQALCRAGQTGDATAPHLHFEMWVGGWQAAGGRPIDPLPYLEAWEQG